MRLSISNIAWDVKEDEAVAKLLQSFSVNAIDVAPGKYFPHPKSASTKDIAKVKEWWYERGIEITGMQALLFGTTGLNVFGSPVSQAALLKHLDEVCRIGAGLGATRLVFGSPKNRDRKGLSDQEVLAVAVPFFRQLGDIAQGHAVSICLEPNPICYGANFMINSSETSMIVRLINHPAIRMQMDTGALAIAGEDPFNVLCESADLLGHVHVSEPDLLPLGDGYTEHKIMASALSKYRPNTLITIEMVATKDEPQLKSIERALRVAQQYYCNEIKVLA